jgi:hypothetical protein
MPLSESDFDNISAIWMLSSYDIDPIVTYKGIADRLGIDEKDARRLVESRPELFSPVIAKKWLEHWKKWVTEGLHYPGWVLKEKETKNIRSISDFIKKTTPARRMVSAFLCELKTCTLGSRSAWASGHFSAQTARRDSSARCRGDAYG